ncbi:MAG: hypothetical protein JNM63_14070 [Spirochaetia bacterium]|nr:hypothetical protein [Spirochaetia bacterium]
MRLITRKTALLFFLVVFSGFLAAQEGGKLQREDGPMSIEKMKEAHSKQSERLGKEMTFLISQTKNEKIKSLCQARLKLDEEAGKLIDSAAANKEDKKSLAVGLRLLSYYKIKGDLLSYAATLLIQNEKEGAPAPEEGERRLPPPPSSPELTSSREAVVKSLDASLVEIDKLLALTKKSLPNKS